MIKLLVGIITDVDPMLILLEKKKENDFSRNNSSVLETDLQPLLGKGSFFLNDKQVLSLMFQSFNSIRNGFEFQHFYSRRLESDQMKEQIVQLDTKVLNLKGDEILLVPFFNANPQVDLVGKNSIFVLVILHCRLLAKKQDARFLLFCLFQSN